MSGSQTPARVLVIAPHADDETIGLGGTIAKHVDAGDDVTVAVLTGHGGGEHPLWPRSVWDTVRAECRAAMDVLGVKSLLFREIPAAMVADQPVHIINRIATDLTKEVAPDTIYAPFPFDLHKDHRELFHAMSVAWRTSSPWGRAVRAIRCYEVQSETHWNVPYAEAGFLPNHFVDISGFLDKKLAAMACYKSQLKPAGDARSLEAVRALAVWRGSLINRMAAEAFVTVRTVD